MTSWNGAMNTANPAVQGRNDAFSSPSSSIVAQQGRTGANQALAALQQAASPAPGGAMPGGQPAGSVAPMAGPGLPGAAPQALGAFALMPGGPGMAPGMAPPASMPGMTATNGLMGTSGAFGRTSGGGLR